MFPPYLSSLIADFNEPALKINGNHFNYRTEARFTVTKTSRWVSWPHGTWLAASCIIWQCAVVQTAVSAITSVSWSQRHEVLVLCCRASLCCRTQRWGPALVEDRHLLPGLPSILQGQWWQRSWRSQWYCTSIYYTILTKHFQLPLMMKILNSLNLQVELSNIVFVFHRSQVQFLR